MNREEALEALKSRRVVSQEGDIADASIFGQAALLGQMDVARLLLDAGANVNGTDAHGFTPLHQACMVNEPGQADVVRWLIANGADISAHACNLGFPLHVAALNGCTESIRVLQAAGADIHAAVFRQRNEARLLKTAGHLSDGVKGRGAGGDKFEELIVELSAVLILVHSITSNKKPGRTRPGYGFKWNQRFLKEPIRPSI